VLPLVIVRQYRGCWEIRGTLSSAFMHGCLEGTQYGASPTLIQRPAFSSTEYCITAFEPHREHLPCSLSVSTRKQSKHSNASDGCSMGLINVPAISTSFRVRRQSTGRLSIGSSESLATSVALGDYELNKPNVNGFTPAANC